MGTGRYYRGKFYSSLGGIDVYVSSHKKQANKTSILIIKTTSQRLVCFTLLYSSYRIIFYSELWSQVFQEELHRELSFPFCFCFCSLATASSARDLSCRCSRNNMQYSTKWGWSHATVKYLYPRPISLLQVYLF